MLTSKDEVSYDGESMKIPPLSIFKQSEVQDRLTTAVCKCNERAGLTAGVLRTVTSLRTFIRTV